jgi:hypothetical protein
VRRFWRQRSVPNRSAQILKYASLELKRQPSRKEPTVEFFGVGAESEKMVTEHCWLVVSWKISRLSHELGTVSRIE